MFESSSGEQQWNARERAAERYFRDLQQSIVAAFEGMEAGGLKFEHDSWQREEGGGGLTCVLQGDGVFEKFGIGFSKVLGAALPSSASARREGIGGEPFCAMGVSLVAHPFSPLVPTAHMNVRFFRTRNGKTGEPVWWFGGGYDLTPHYPVEKDCVHWHQTAKAVCEQHYDTAFYEKLKVWCDDYFFIKHRNCARGIGGIFFDDLSVPDFDSALDFVKDVGNSFIDAYEPIVAANKDRRFTDSQRQFQLYRRGRYVEFNLVYDRGTLFGLQSGGRVESILMSLPPLVRFDYCREDDPQSEEAKLEAEYLVPRDWANFQISE